MLFAQRINSSAASANVRAQQCVARIRVVPTRRCTGLHTQLQAKVIPVAPCPAMSAQQGAIIAAADQVHEPASERVLGWQRTLAKVVLGALLCSVLVGIALLWGQPPSALLTPGSGLAYTIDTVGLTTMASYLTKQQAIALVWGLFMFLSTAAGPMLTLGDRNVAPNTATITATNTQQPAYTGNNYGNPHPVLLAYV